MDEIIADGTGLMSGVQSLLNGAAVTLPVLVPQLTCLLSQGLDPILPDEGLNNLLDDVGDFLAPD